MKILINAFGIANSGGVRVLKKVLDELFQNQCNQYIFFCNSEVVIKLAEEYKDKDNFKFKLIPNYGFLHRMYFENFIFKKFINTKKIDLVYNFSGSKQFFSKTPQLIKIQNLLFYSKSLDRFYWSKNQLILWLKEIFLKRLVFKMMLNTSKNIEIQSSHVINSIQNFMDIKEKNFYIKSDVDIQDKEFQPPKKYDFSKKINFLYIVGPHFEYLHKNIIDFTNSMLFMNNNKVNFQITITLSREQLSSSKAWDISLNSKTNFVGYVSDDEKMMKLFSDNTILISTSIIETLGLHVIEGIKNGVITIAPNEEYANTVYGENIFKYDLSDRNLSEVIMGIINFKESISDKILFTQNYLRQNEMIKLRNINEIFDEVVNVQK